MRNMTRKNRVVKHLKMMGYDVKERYGFIRIELKTSSGKSIVHIINVELCYEDFTIEKLVRKINEEIQKQF